MTEPPPYQQAWMHTVEGTVNSLREEFPKMLDADLEFVYKQLRGYFDKVAKGQGVAEPTSTSERRQALIDELLNAIEAREEMGADKQVVNNAGIQPAGRPIPSLAAFYVICLNQLHKSVRLWAKEPGKTTYLNFIRDFLA